MQQRGKRTLKLLGLPGNPISEEESYFDMEHDDVIYPGVT